MNVPPFASALVLAHLGVGGKQHGAAVFHNWMALHAEVQVRGCGGVHPDLGGLQHQGAFMQACITHGPSACCSSALEGSAGMIADVLGNGMEI